MKLLFLDTETTGTDPLKHGIIQISGIIEIDGDIKQEFNFRCRPFPGKLYNSKALEVNGKTVEEIKTFADPASVYKELMCMLNRYVDKYNKNDKFYLVGQNVKFDYDFMAQWFKDNGNKFFYAYIAYHLLDIMCLSMFFNLCGIITTKNMKLATIADYFNIKFDAHDSLEDIKVTRDIYYKFLELMKK